MSIVLYLNMQAKGKYHLSTDSFSWPPLLFEHALDSFDFCIQRIVRASSSWSARTIPPSTRHGNNDSHGIAGLFFFHHSRRRLRDRSYIRSLPRETEFLNVIMTNPLQRGSYRLHLRSLLVPELCAAHWHESKIIKVRSVIIQFIQQSHMHRSPTTFMLTSPFLASGPHSLSTTLRLVRSVA